MTPSFKPHDMTPLQNLQTKELTNSPSPSRGRWWGLLLLILLVSSCKTTNPTDACRVDSASVVFYPIEVKADTGSVTGIIRVSPDGFFSLSDIGIQTSERMRMSVGVDSVGRLNVTATTTPDTIEGRKEERFSRQETHSSTTGKKGDITLPVIALLILAIVVIAWRK